jgi:hypothetical protein
MNNIVLLDNKQCQDLPNIEIKLVDLNNEPIIIKPKKKIGRPKKDPKDLKKYIKTLVPKMPKDKAGRLLYAKKKKHELRVSHAKALYEFVKNNSEDVVIEKLLTLKIPNLM